MLARNTANGGKWRGSEEQRAAEPRILLAGDRSRASKIHRWLATGIPGIRQVVRGGWLLEP